MAGCYVADSARSIWQFRPGTVWSNYDTRTDDALSATFRATALERLGPAASPLLYCGAHRFSRRCELDSPRVNRPSPSAPLSASILELGRLREVPGGGVCWLRGLARVFVRGLGGHEVRADWAAVSAELRTHAAAAVGDLNSTFGLQLTVGGDAVAADGGAADGPGAGDLLLQLSSTVSAVSGAYANAYLLDAPPWQHSSSDGGSGTRRPITIDAPTVKGIEEGLATLRRSVGAAVAGVGSPHPHQGVAGDTETASEPGVFLPSCYLLDAPSASGNTRWLTVAMTTDLQPLDAFVRLARHSREYQPSHSRVLRRVTSYNRSDGKRVQIAGRGLATLVSYSDAEISVQFGETDPVEALPLKLAAEPVARATR